MSHLKSCAAELMNRGSRPPFEYARLSCMARVSMFHSYILVRGGATSVACVVHVRFYASIIASLKPRSAGGGGPLKMQRRSAGNPF